MKILFASIKFLVLIPGIVFSCDLLEAASGKSSESAATIAAEGRSGAATSTPANTDASVNLESPAIQKQRQRLDELVRQLNDLLTRHTEKDRRVKATRKEIADLQKELVRELTAARPAAGGAETNQMPKANNASARITDTGVKTKSTSATAKITNATMKATSAKATNIAGKGTNTPVNIGLLTSAPLSHSTNVPAKGTSPLVKTNDATIGTTNVPAEAKSTKTGNSTDKVAMAKSTDVPVNGPGTASEVRLLTSAAASNGGNGIANASAALANPNTNAPTNARLTPAATSGTNAAGGTNVSVSLASMETLDDKHRLAIGDKLSFRIEEDKHRLPPPIDKIGMHSEEDPTPLLVTDSGELEVPYIGRFPAENKTCKHLAYELKAALEKDYFYQATVIVAVDLKTKSRGRVYLNGAVHVPGPQEIPSDEVLTLGKAILRAGGFTDFAERHNVKVTRKVGTGPSANKTLVVDVAQVFDKGKTERDLPLEPGDLILVSERLIRF